MEIRYLLHTLTLSSPHNPKFQNTKRGAKKKKKKEKKRDPIFSVPRNTRFPSDGRERSRPKRKGKKREEETLMYSDRNGND